MRFNTLYAALEGYAGEDVVGDLLQPVLDEAQAELATQARHRSFDPTLPSDFSEEASWNWYALSRVYDWLILDSQRDLPGAVTRGTRELRVETSHISGGHPYRASHFGRGLDDPWDGPRVDMRGVSAFLTELGFSRLPGVEGDEGAATRRFHPFFHELVDLVEDPGASICTVSAVVWPGWMWGDMMFARAGVVVRCPPGMFRRELAVDSTLYFAYDRLHRPTADLSHGWGHNSQWRTDFRRDYARREAFFYNVDAKWSIEEGAPTELPSETRIELLRHRSMVVSPEHEAVFPYDDRHVELRHEAHTRIE